MAGPIEADVVVLGVGTCGEDLSLQLLDAGLEVVGIEAALVGGECPFWACLPSKRMIRMANLITEAQRAKVVADVTVRADWPRLAAQVRAEVTGGGDDSIGVERFGSRGGTLVKGRGSFTGPRTITVGDVSYTGRRGVVIATGSSPAMPAVPGLTDVEAWTNHDIISMEELPSTITVLGGGAVGCELGQVMARFGAGVTIIEGGDGLLPAEEPEAGAAITEAFTGAGIDVRIGSLAARVDAVDGGIAVTLGDGSVVTSERLLVATGRTVQLDGLGLDEAGIEAGGRYIEVDEHMRAGDGAWAVGDVTGKAMFTHVALYQAGIAVADILDRDHAPARYHAVPRVTFTDPEVGAVGMTEAEARAAGIDVVVAVKQVAATFRGWLHSTTGPGVIKLVADRHTGSLVGATTMGPQGGEVLGLLSLAVHAAVPLAELRNLIYPFPTFFGGVGEAIGAYGRGVGTVLDPGYEGLAALDAITDVS